MQQGNIRKALDNLDNAGYRLRCAREYMGLSEKEIADELKLMVSHVRAIEQNRSEYLVQRKPFERYLRAYARLVQLNPDTIVAMYFANSEPTQSIDINTRLEAPSLAFVVPPVTRSNFLHPAIFGAGFLVIGLSLFAGWGMKQFVGSSYNKPQLAQSDRVEVRASNSRPSVAAARQELEAVRFEKPVTSVAPVNGEPITSELQPIAVAVQQRAMAEQSIGDGPGTAAEPAASQRVEKVALPNVTVDVKPVPIIESTLEPTPQSELPSKPEVKPEPKQPVAIKADSDKARVAAKDVTPKPSAADSAQAPFQASQPKRIIATAKTAVIADKAETKTIDLTATVAGNRLAENKAAKTALVANKPALATVAAQSTRKRDSDFSRKVATVRRDDDVAKTQPLVARAETAPSEVKAAAPKAGPAAGTLLQPLAVSSQQRIAPQATIQRDTLEADDIRQILAANSEPRAELQAPKSAANGDLGLTLDGEALDLDAVINDNVEDVRPFEPALANSSDSASVARLALLESYKSTLRRRVYENITYPGMAQRRNHEGKVVMNATVSRGGQLLSVEMTEASRYGSLNRASERAIKNASPFPAAPDTLSGEAFLLTVPVVFKVPQR